MLDIDSGAQSNPAVAGWEAAGLRAPDMDVVRSWRLQQLRIQLEAEDVAGIVLFDPLNIRYAMIHYLQDWDTYGYDGVIEDGVVLCLEVYVGEPGGHEGIKLENQVYITTQGAEVLDTFPMALIPH